MKAGDAQLSLESPGIEMRAAGAQGNSGAGVGYCNRSGRGKAAYKVMG